jgi:hypothetical protein
MHKHALNITMLTLAVEPNSSSRRKHTMFLTCAKTMSVIAVAVLFSLVAMDGAIAEGGCGPGFHRNEFGGCRPNGPVAPCAGALTCTCRVQCGDIPVGKPSPAIAACIGKCVAAKTAAQH